MKDSIIFVAIASIIPATVVGIIKTPVYGVMGFITGLLYAMVIVFIQWLTFKMIALKIKIDKKKYRIIFYRLLIVVELIGSFCYVLV